MDGPTSSTSRTTHEVEYETVTKRARRGLGGWWWLALLAVPLILAALASFIQRGGIQDDLKADSLKALNGQGITGADVDFDGRDGTITLPAGADAAKAKNIVENVDGVRVADVKGGAAAAAPSATDTAPATPSETSSAPATSAPAPAAGAGTFALTNQGDSVVVEGVVPDEAAKKTVVDAATKAAGDTKVIDKVTVKAGAPAPDAAQLAKGFSSLPAGEGVKLDFDGQKVTLTGEVADDAAKKAAGDKATGDFPGVTVDNQLTVKGGAAAADCGKVDQTVTALVKGNNPTFADNSTRLVSASKPTLNKVAAAIKACPDAKVTIAGHTDNTGTPARNKTLSQGRANAVKTYLSGQGVKAANITATGFGQDKPIAPNTTAAGRDANRRVDITVQGG
ncbi:channel-forming protein ArfA/OmpATb [Luteipulveratus halotolerans]|uniref:channel-forming protein ArfA/OmpATb n=1 Tax=Luteipulveratus halotolerans TaxID=1631356 RepID=UPI0012FB5E1E|nr:OmpA family protein [Luteipulveratus halotolerans]